jgi:hypothetical protein
VIVPNAPTDEGDDDARSNVSATITVNGTLILAPRDFRRGTTILERAVTLEANNRMDVTVRGPRGGAIIVEIIGTDNDRPTITAEANPPPNANGWNNTNVTVTFTCSDATSGIASCPAPVTVTAEGAGQVVSGTAVDKAGNSASASVTLNIDKTPPTITGAASPIPNGNGWNNTDVTVTFTCGDGLSGVATCPAPVTVATEGANQVANGTAVDKAGNSASASVTLNIDKTPPAITGSASPPANGDGWNNGDVIVTFNCADGLSGVATCPAPVTVGAEGSQTVSGTAVDRAGNQAQTTLTVQIDRTPPTISGVASPAPNGDGWNNTDVTVTFTCADGLSGVATCPAPVTVATEGAGQTVPGTAFDRADNSASTSVTVSLDKTMPLLQIDSPPDGATVPSSPVTVSGTATDALSGIKSVECNGTAATVAGSNFTCDVPIVAGDNTILVEARDAAGNVATASRTVRLEAGGDTTPPVIHITSPGGGSFVFQGRPPIDLTYSDAGGVDLATLALTANGAPLGADCELTATGGSCTPFSPLPEGSVTIGASIKDVAGNVGSTGVTFTIDSVPVEVHIDSPETGLITRDTEAAVQGTVGAGVTGVDVNGVAASLSGPSFSATVPLRQGTNMLVAVARKANGKTGTHSVDVTQDLVAPIVRIDSPRDGFVSTTDLVTVTGLVNDIVNGGRDAGVTVNGVAAPVASGSFMLMDLKLVRGPNHIEAVGTDAVGNVGRHSIDVTFQAPVGLRLTMVSGNGQEALVRQTLAQPLVVMVKDDLGNPAAGRVVHFRATRNNGTLRASPSDLPARMVDVPTDGSGRAAVLFTLGDTTGEGTNRVVATAVGVAGEVEFCANGLPAPAQKILMTMGDNQRGVVGQPLATPLEALVVDRDGNPLAGVEVTFSVVLGGGNLDGQPTATRLTGTDGLARAVVTLSPEPGINNNVVHAAFEGLAGLPATFTSSGLVPGDPAQTGFAGVVLDNALAPIPGAIISIPGTTPLNTTTTDALGQFTLASVPVGHIHLRIDPSTSPRPEKFPPLEFETVTVAGQRNILGQPILIPAINPTCTVVGGPADVTVAMQGVPGLNLTVFANSVTARDGSPTACITISQVHLDKVPMAPPSGTIFMPPAWTIQPAGTHFNPPARITIPNDGMPAGRMIDIFQFDHDLNQFVNVGKGTTSEDGLLIVSDPGFGITGAGWGGCGQPQPPTTCAGSCDDGKACTTDSCQNGSCAHTNLTTAQTTANGCNGCNNGTPLPPKTTVQCCTEKSLNAGGWVVCCNGVHTACTNPAGLGGNATLVACADQHEHRHFQDNSACPTGADECKTSGPLGVKQPDPGDTLLHQSECEASKVEVACLQAACAGVCPAVLADRIAQMKNFGNTNLPGCFPP